MFWHGCIQDRIADNNEWIDPVGLRSRPNDPILMLLGEFAALAGVLLCVDFVCGFDMGAGTVTPIYELQLFGGWESVEMVRRYAHLAPEHLAQAAARIVPISTKMGTKMATVESPEVAAPALSN